MKDLRIGKLNINVKIPATVLSVVVCCAAFFICAGKFWQRGEAPVFDNEGTEAVTEITESGKAIDTSETGPDYEVMFADNENEINPAAEISTGKLGVDEADAATKADIIVKNDEKTVSAPDEKEDTNKSAADGTKTKSKKNKKSKQKNSAETTKDAITSDATDENSSGEAEMVFLLSFDGHNVVNGASVENVSTTSVEKNSADKKEAQNMSVSQKELVLEGMSQGDKKAKKSKELECKYNPDMDIKLSDEEYEILCRIVEAEAGDQDVYGRILVANVILNRTKFWEFPDTVKEVVFQVNSNGAVQFAPISDGSFYRVEISDTTKKAVDSALSGDDYSDGALYFFMRSATSSAKASWFDTLDFVLKYGCHEFFK